MYGKVIAVVVGMGIVATPAMASDHEREHGEQGPAAAACTMAQPGKLEREFFGRWLEKHDRDGYRRFLDCFKPKGWEREDEDQDGEDEELPVRPLGQAPVAGGFGGTTPGVTTPEPATVLLLGAGLVLLGVAGRRRA